MPTPSHDPDEVIPATDRGGYLVASLSRPGAFWMVRPTLGALECPCEAGTQITAAAKPLGSRGRYCRHAKVLLRWIAAQNQANARPSAPANVAALTD